MQNAWFCLKKAKEPGNIDKQTFILLSVKLTICFEKKSSILALMNREYIKILITYIFVPTNCFMKCKVTIQVEFLIRY